MGEQLSDEWVPPVMGVEELTRLTAVEPGYPTYMKEQIIRWVVDTSTLPNGAFMPSVPQELSLRMKRLIPADLGPFTSFLWKAADDLLTNLIDAMLYFRLGRSYRTADKLASILDSSRSEWQVQPIGGRSRITQRIPTGVQISYEDVVNKTALAGSLLAEAFEATYGMAPNPNHAYDLSVKAVETLACHAFIPNNTTRATLGAVIAHLQQKTVSLPLIEKNASHGETITKMMRLLWEGGQRHGDGNYQHVSLAGAKTAQALAFSLVAMIHEGLISTF
ncbi:hypothetical protein NicSoilC12_14160 [Arthrobacter sp. NicSoilC12]|nr:hypothetical protein NicSoilC12_14160 [Arthrobacter sp. NicSoilC12]